VEGSCVHGDEPSGSVKFWEHREQLHLHGVSYVKGVVCHGLRHGRGGSGRLHNSLVRT
jgi:hypothetical protein